MGFEPKVQDPFGFDSLRANSRAVRSVSPWIDANIADLTFASEIVDHCSLLLEAIYDVHESDSSDRAKRAVLDCLAKLVIAADLIAEDLDLSLAAAIRIEIGRSVLRSKSWCE
jgi:hypothetical protein